jgi:hypothetical protein
VADPVIEADARYRHWLVCQPLCLWAGGVNMAISTFETLPFVERRIACNGLTNQSVMLSECSSFPFHHPFYRGYSSAVNSSFANSSMCDGSKKEVA